MRLSLIFILTALPFLVSCKSRLNNNPLPVKLDPFTPSESELQEEPSSLEPEDEQILSPAGPLPGVLIDSSINAVKFKNAWLAVYSVTDQSYEFEKVGFHRSGPTTTAFNEYGTELWTYDIGEGPMTGGFDIDSDGWPDFAIAKKELLPSLCGSKEQFKSWLDVYSGKTGRRLSATSKIDDKCWNFSGTIYPTRQWSQNSLLFGPRAGKMFLSPVYSTNSWIYSRDLAGQASTNSIIYPSTRSFDNTYINSTINDWPGENHAFHENSHLANGLMIREQGRDRLVFFTSGRVVQYEDTPLSSTQLLFDRPYRSSADVAGRNYGLVQVDPTNSGNIALISGASTLSVYRDHVAGERKTNPNGAIERHVSIYNFRGNTIEDRYYGRIYDNNNNGHYLKRIVHPSNAMVGAPIGNSRIAYSEYDDNDGNWKLHISQPGSTADKYALGNLFLWDIQDIDGDGQLEWIASQDDPNRKYFLKPQTRIYRWNEAKLTLDPVETKNGLPVMTLRFRRADTSQSSGSLTSVTLTPNSEGKPELLMFMP